MASEKRLSISFSVIANGLTASGIQSASYDLAGTNFVGDVRSAPTTAALIPLSGLASFEKVYIRNNDPTNYIEIGGDSGLTVFKIKILPGEVVYFTLPNTQPYIKANVAPCDYQIVACEP